MLVASPDKWIRKYFADYGFSVPIYDANSVNENDTLYMVMSNQTKFKVDDNKCFKSWDCGIIIEIIQRSQGTANKGSRVVINDLENEVITAFNNITVTGYYLINKEYDSNSIVTQGINQVIDRQIININLKLK
jgi:hypothetical protein